MNVRVELIMKWEKSPLKQTLDLDLSHLSKWTQMCFFEDRDYSIVCLPLFLSFTLTLCLLLCYLFCCVVPVAVVSLTKRCVSIQPINASAVVSIVQLVSFIHSPSIVYLFQPFHSVSPLSDYWYGIWARIYNGWSYVTSSCGHDHININLQLRKELNGKYWNRD